MKRGICENCSKEKTLRTTKFCHACYQGMREFGKDYKPKIFKKSLVGTKCIKCGKIRKKEAEIENNFCRKCYLYTLPGYHEKQKKRTRDYQRKKRGIDTELPLLCAPAGSGSIKKGQGYRVICKKEFIGIPHADKKGRIAEHTYIMMIYLGRPLFKGETVHHKNGIRHDNRIENLELWSSSHPSGQRIKDKLKWCYDFIEKYKDHKG